jgi:hypothetical protein
MGELYGYRKRVSSVALLQASGAEDAFATVLKLAEQGRQEWEALSPAARQQVTLEAENEGDDEDAQQQQLVQQQVLQQQLQQ